MLSNRITRTIFTFGTLSVALVIGSGCQPVPQAPQDLDDATNSSPGAEVENPSTVIDTDPDHEPMNVME